MTMDVPPPLKKLEVDLDWTVDLLVDLLRIPSPAGRTDTVMQFLGEQLERLHLPFELTRRGAMVVGLPSADTDAGRAVVVHADTLGMIVTACKDNGRLAVLPIGTHSARFSEGARVTVFTDQPDVTYTGTVLPLKASGHAFDVEVDTQGVGWDHVEVRLDAHVHSADDLASRGIQVGDFVVQHAVPEITATGFVKSRHLDGKAGVAAVLGGAKAILDAGLELPVTTHLLITITEEVGHGASHGLRADVAEMVSVDVGVVAPGQHSTETGVTIAMQDMTGPFDFHLTRRLAAIASEYGIEHHRDVFRYYRSDVAAAIEAGAEMRAALIGVGVDATHGHERTHLDSIRHTAELIALYLQTELTFADWDAAPMGPLEDFPSTSVQPAEQEPRLETRPGDPPIR